jgi:hypothetical protein
LHGRLDLLEVEERLDHEEVDPPPLEEARLLEEDVVGALGSVAPLEVAERADRPRDENGHAADFPRLARELDPALHDLLEPIVEELGRELAPIRSEGVRLDQLGAGPDEAEVHLDDGLGRFQVRFLGATEARDDGSQERAGPAVGDDDAALVQSLERPAHAAETTAAVSVPRDEEGPSAVRADPDPPAEVVAELGHLLELVCACGSRIDQAFLFALGEHGRVTVIDPRPDIGMLHLRVRQEEESAERLERMLAAVLELPPVPDRTARLPFARTVCSSGRAGRAANALLAGQAAKRRPAGV